jgi:hypothetical protein
LRAAEDSIHAKTLLAEDMTSDRYTTLMQGFIDSEKEGDIADHDYRFTGDGAAEVADMTRVLQASVNYYVAPAMVDLATQIASSMPDEPLLPNDVPTQQGWMWLGTPYRVIDIRRKALSMNAVLWTVRGHGVKIWHYTHKNDPNDSVNFTLRHRFTEREWAQVPWLNLNHVMYLPFDEILPRGISWDAALPIDAKVELTKSKDEYGNVTGYSIATDHYIDTHEAPRTVRSPLAEFILCTWRLCQQSLATVTTENPGRAFRHREKRANLPEKPVSVVTLRRINHAPVGESHVEWSHRWLVDGHWRNQPYKEEGEVVYRQIYIHPYFKGPEDKPLLIRRKVRALVR